MLVLIDKLKGACMNKLKFAVLLSSAIFSASALADGDDIRHPALRAAYRDCNASIQAIEVGQRNNDNRGVFGGHAVRAIQLLQQAKHEIEESDEFRNRHGG
jgi:hypothetical protein